MNNLSILDMQLKVVKGLAPAADRWNTDPATDVVNVSGFERVGFLVHQQGGTTGNATFTVESCDNVTPSNTTAIPFRYRVGADGAGAGGDDFGDPVEATAAGFASTAATDRLYLIEVVVAHITTGRKYLRLKCTETTNDPVNGSVEIFLLNPRYAQMDQPTAIA